MFLELVAAAALVVALGALERMNALVDAGVPHQLRLLPEAPAT